MQTIFYNYAAISGKWNNIDFECNFVLHFCLGVQFSNYGTTTVTVSISSVQQNPFEFNHSVLNVYIHLDGQKLYFSLLIVFSPKMKLVEVIKYR